MRYLVSLDHICGLSNSSELNIIQFMFGREEYYQVVGGARRKNKEDVDVENWDLVQTAEE